VTQLQPSKTPLHHPDLLCTPDNHLSKEDSDGG
jgi:hypothetical protein